MRYGLSAVVLYMLLVIPPIRNFLESIMILHMLVQIPLLIVAGWLLGKLLGRHYPVIFRGWNEDGIPGIIIVICITMYWMIPRTVDEALIFPSIEVFKFISLPIVGILLADSWKKIKSIGMSFVFLNYLSMFGLMGWLYLDSPIQICNNYLVAEQKTLGWGFLTITAAMVLYLIQYVFMDHSQDQSI